jgi:hypothetical protein
VDSLQVLQALGDAAAGQPPASHVLHRQAEIRMKRIEQNPPRWLHNRITTAAKEVVRVKRGLGKSRTPKRRLKRELKQAQIECAYAQHWVMLT